MSADFLQSVSQIAIFIGVIISAAGGLGSYYFGHKSETELKNNVKTLVDKSNKLEHSLQPFLQLASESHPNLEIEQALEQLREDYERLKADLKDTAEKVKPVRLEYVKHYVTKVDKGLMLHIEFKRTQEKPTERMVFIVKLNRDSTSKLVSIRPSKSVGMFVGGDRATDYEGRLEMLPIVPGDPTIEITVTEPTQITLISNLTDHLTIDISDPTLGK